MPKDDTNEQGGQQTLDEQIAIAAQTLERNIGFINNCDNKTSIVLTVIGVLLTIMLTNEGVTAILRVLRGGMNEKTFSGVMFLGCFVVSSAVMCKGIYDLSQVLFARIKESASGIKDQDSKLFFVGIKKCKDYQAYHKAFCNMTKEQLLADLTAQVYINAEIATEKYALYNGGLKNTLIGFVSFLAVIAIGLYLY